MTILGADERKMLLDAEPRYFRGFFLRVLGVFAFFCIFIQSLLTFKCVWHASACTEEGYLQISVALGNGKTMLAGSNSTVQRRRFLLLPS